MADQLKLSSPELARIQNAVGAPGSVGQYAQAYREVLAIKFGKEYAVREPDFVKITNALSPENLLSMLDINNECWSASVEEYYQEKPVIWSIVIADKSKNDLTFILLKTTACRRAIEAHR